MNDKYGPRVLHHGTCAGFGRETDDSEHEPVTSNAPAGSTRTTGEVAHMAQQLPPDEQVTMVASNQRMPRTPSILAIEPDPARAQALTQLVHEYMDATVVVSASADVAVSVIAKRIPELILMSAFTPPHEERTLIEFLRQATQVNVPVLIVWPIFERRSEKTPVSSSLYRVLRRTRKAGAGATSMRDERGAWMRVALETAREQYQGTTGSLQQAACVARAHRWTPWDLSWLAGVRLPSGYVKQVVNISNSGLLVESDSALMPGSSVTFQLCANATELWHPNTELLVPARIVRSEVSKVDTDHLRYLVAAQFQREVELPSQVPMPRSEAATIGEETVAGGDIDAVALRAGERLHELARALESLELTVARICPSTRRQRRPPHPSLSN